MTAEVLKVAYYRATADEDIQREYFIRKYRELSTRFAELLEKFSMGIAKEMRLSANQSLERFRQLLITMFEAVAQSAFNHKDDIENLVLLANKLNSMTDSEQKEYIKQLEAEFEK
jgi:hypothetical protein